MNTLNFYVNIYFYIVVYLCYNYEKKIAIIFTTTLKSHVPKTKKPKAIESNWLKSSKTQQQHLHLENKKYKAITASGELQKRENERKKLQNFIV